MKKILVFLITVVFGLTFMPPQMEQDFYTMQIQIQDLQNQNEILRSDLDMVNRMIDNTEYAALGTAIQGVKISDSATVLTPIENVVTIPNATTSADGTMSSEDKTAHNGLVSEVNVGAKILLWTGSQSVENTSANITLALNGLKTCKIRIVGTIDASDYTKIFTLNSSGVANVIYAPFNNDVVYTSADTYLTVANVNGPGYILVITRIELYLN